MSSIYAHVDEMIGASALPQCMSPKVARSRHADCVSRCRFRGQSGKHMLALSFSGFDPVADILLTKASIQDGSRSLNGKQSGEKI